MPDHNGKELLHPTLNCTNFFRKRLASICGYAQWSTVNFGLLKGHHNKYRINLLKILLSGKAPGKIATNVVTQVWTTSIVFHSNTLYLSWESVVEEWRIRWSFIETAACSSKLSQLHKYEILTGQWNSIASRDSALLKFPLPGLARKIMKTDLGALSLSVYGRVQYSPKETGRGKPLARISCKLYQSYSGLFS